MNKHRRNQIKALALQIDELRGKFEDFVSEAESIRDDEQEYFDNMPESIQSGEKGERAQAAIDALENAVEALNEIANQIDTAVTGLSEAEEA